MKSKFVNRLVVVSVFGLVGISLLIAPPSDPAIGDVNGVVGAWFGTGVHGR